MKSYASLDHVATPDKPGRWQELRQTLKTWNLRSRQRKQLAGLDLRTLRDIGVHPVDAMHEARKPFWRA